MSMASDCELSHSAAQALGLRPNHHDCVPPQRRLPEDGRRNVRPRPQPFPGNAPRGDQEDYGQAVHDDLRRRGHARDAGPRVRPPRVGGRHRERAAAAYPAGEAGAGQEGILHVWRPHTPAEPQARREPVLKAHGAAGGGCAEGTPGPMLLASVPAPIMMLFLAADPG